MLKQISRYRIIISGKHFTTSSNKYVQINNDNQQDSAFGRSLNYTYKLIQTTLLFADGKLDKDDGQ